MTIKKSIIFFVIITVSFLNFQFNFFHVVSNERFDYFQVESEQFVTDGYLNSILNNYELTLGQFKRPSIDMFNEGHKYKPREWYKNKFVEGDFWEYKSHFGLQKYIFFFLDGNLFLLHCLSSLFMSLFVLLIFCFIKRQYSSTFAIIFTVVLILSPWIVPLARNGYFLLSITFLPFLTVLFFVEKIIQSRAKLALMLFFIGLFIFLKSLIGYDYLSNIVLSALIPLIYYYSKNKITLKKTLLISLGVFIVSIAGFSSAVGLHYFSLEKIEENPGKWIYYTAAKRLSSNDSDQVAYETCYELLKDENGNFDLNSKESISCLEEIKTSLSASRFSVIKKYLSSRYLIPFVGSFHLNITKMQKGDLKNIFNSPSTKTDKIKGLVNYMWTNWNNFSFLELFSVFCNYVLSFILFIILLILYIKEIFVSNNKRKLYLISILLPPLSWMILAKGHAYVTVYQCSYFIMYIPTIPFMIAEVLKPSSKTKIKNQIKN